MSSGKILCIVHQKHSKTRRVGRVLKQKGFELDIRRPCLGQALPESLDGYAGTVVFGGPMSAYDCDKFDFIKRELDWLPMAVEQKPFLGICLGAQLLSRAAGGSVAPHAEGLHEVGYFPIHATEEGRELFAGCTHAYQFHKDGFEIPRGAVRLATGEMFENQAFRIGDRAFGLQFHPELTPKTMELWQGHAERKQLPGSQTVAELIAARDKHEKRTRRWLYRFLDHWLATPQPSLQKAA